MSQMKKKTFPRSRPESFNAWALYSQIIVVRDWIITTHLVYLWPKTGEDEGSHTMQRSLVTIHYCRDLDRVENHSRLIGHVLLLYLQGFLGKFRHRTWQISLIAARPFHRTIAQCKLLKLFGYKMVLVVAIFRIFGSAVRGTPGAGIVAKPFCFG